MSPQFLGYRLSLRLHNPIALMQPAIPVLLSEADHTVQLQQEANSPKHGRSRFSDLPGEIILAVAGRLETENQVLLSLTCKRMFLLLSPDVDLSLRCVPFAARLRVLRHLELDHPEYLTCRECGRLFKWQQRRFARYLCPCSWSLKRGTRRHVYFVFDCTRITINREIVDLILRAHKRGILHGVLPSALNDEEYKSFGVTRKTEARIVNGHLLFASYSRAEVGRQREEVERGGYLEWSLCLHQKFRLRDELWQTVWQFVSSTKLSGEFALTKCTCCATDSKLHIHRISGNRFLVELKVWRDFGTGDDGVQITEQMFDYDATSVDPILLSRRDLQADFETQSAIRHNLEHTGKSEYLP